MTKNDLMASSKQAHVAVVALMVTLILTLEVSKGFSQARYSVTPCADYQEMSRSGVLAGRRNFLGRAQVLLGNAADARADPIIVTIPKAHYVSVFSVNDHGMVVARANFESESDERLVLLDTSRPDIHQRRLTIQGRPPKGCCINNDGLVVGTVSIDGHERAALWDAGSTSGGFVLLLAPSGSSSHAEAINNCGIVAGTITLAGHARAVIWNAKCPKSPPVFLGDEKADARALHLNDKGIVVGCVITEDGDRAALWNAHKPRAAPRMLPYLFEADISLTLALGRRHTVAWMINNNGTIVGRQELRNADPPVTVEIRYAVWDYADRVVELGPKLDQTNKSMASQEPWTIQSIGGLDDKGRILAQCSRGQQRKAVLLTPSADIADAGVAWSQELNCMWQQDSIEGMCAGPGTLDNRLERGSNTENERAGKEGDSRAYSRAAAASSEATITTPVRR